MGFEDVEIKDLFEKDIFRRLNGVIKVDQSDEESVFTELNEFVITEETTRNLTKFFNAFNEVVEQGIDDVGVWVSGFFGSGKSHFIKMLSYLLENRVVKGKAALDFFKEKINDPMLMGDIERAVHGFSRDVILFNIDAKANAVSRENESIVSVFMRVFNEQRGFLGDVFWIAELEEDIQAKGLYDRFKDEFAKINGDSWESKRASYAFEQDDVVDALVACEYQSREALVRLFESDGRSYHLSISKFAEKVKEYCDLKGNDHQLLFFVDEVGQFIGEDGKMMLNLQTIEEQLGKTVLGRSWVVVTAQADMDTITREKLKGYDFSKIQGRFKWRLPLSSTNVDEVISKRVLAKKDKYAEMLCAFYDEKKTVLNNLVVFDQTAELKKYGSAEEFAIVYPFIPYQFTLLQKVFDKIRQTGYSGKHLAKGERSMLSAYKEAAECYGHEKIGVLVPFSTFYQTVESFLDPIIKRTIDQAKKNSCLEPQDISLLKVLFMVRHVKELEPTKNNLAVLSISRVDEDMLALRDQVADSLKRLEEQTLVHQTQGKYYFLTNEEQEITRDIKSTDIDRHQIIDEVYNVVFSDICPNRYKVYSFHKSVDDKLKPSSAADMSVRFVTPLSDDYVWSMDQQSLDGGRVGLIGSEDSLVVVFPKDNHFIDDVKHYLQINKYLRQNSSSKNNKIIQGIFTEKTRERDELRDRFQIGIKDGVSQAKIYVCGQEVRIDTTNPKDRIEEGLGKLVENVFLKYGYVTRDFDAEDIPKVLKADDLERIGIKNETNKLARNEILDFLRVQKEQNLRVLLKQIKERFMHKPYGWKDMTVSGLVAQLYVAEDVKLRFQQTYLLPDQREDIGKHLTNSRDEDKLVIELREKTDEQKISQVRSLIRDVFDKMDLPFKEIQLFSICRDIINEKRSHLQNYLGKYEEENRYPGKKVLEVYDQLLSKILDEQDPSLFFDQLITQDEQLRSAHENVKPVLGFFSGKQLEIFRRQLKNLDVYIRNQQFISGDAARAFESIQSIVSMEEPYASIKDLIMLESTINKQLDVALEQEKEKINVMISDYSKKVSSELSQKASLFSDDERKHIIQPIEDFKKMITEQKEPVLIFNKQFQLKEIYKNALGCIEEKQKTKVGKEPSESYGKKQVFIDRSDFFKYDKAIETEDDLDAYLVFLKKKMSELLKDNKIRIM
jgi:hypothetical protein